MKNLSKTTKTILFASLIAAMILPFSGMMMADAATNEDANNVAKENTAKRYNVEILERTVLDTIYENGQKTERQIHKIKLIDIPTLEDLKNDDAEYLDFLRTLGPDGEKAAATIIADYAKNLENLETEFSVDVIRIGEHSIYFSPVTYDPSSYALKDPVNVIFHQSGSAANANYITDVYANHSWHNAVGGSQLAYIDESAHGGSAYFQTSSYQLEEGNFWDRTHLRQFVGNYDTHGTFDYWSIAGVHNETWDVYHHVIDTQGWETAELEISIDLSGKTGVGTISSYNTGYSGTLQGQPFDKYQALIELT